MTPAKINGLVFEMFNPKNSPGQCLDALIVLRKNGVLMSDLVPALVHTGPSQHGPVPSAPLETDRANPEGWITLGFGKHAGKRIDDLLPDHRGYLEWMSENITNAKVKEQAKKLLNKGEMNEPDMPEPDQDCPF